MNPLNDEPSAIDGLLDEWLGQSRPSVVTPQLLEKKTFSPERMAELDAALIAAQKDMLARRIQPRSAASYRKRHRHYSGLFMLATMAASLLAIAGGWFAYSYRDKLQLIDNQPLAKMDLPPSTDANSPNEQKTAALQPAAETIVKSTQVAKTKAPETDPSRESLPSNTLPFEKSKTKPKLAELPKTVAKVPKRSETEIVKSIDDHLQGLWAKYQVQPSAPVSDAEWIARATKQLLNRQPTESERERFVKKDSQSARSEWLADTLINSEMARHWGRQLAAFYQGEPIGLSRDLDETRREFVKWCQGELLQSNSLNALAYKVVVLDTTPSVTPTDFSASRFWWRKMRSTGQHAAVDVLESRLLGGVGSCSRCHDSGTVETAHQSTYWNLVAIAQGVSMAQSADGSIGMASYRSVEEPLFYEREDASMVAAVPAIPNGKFLEGLSGDSAQVRSIARRNLKEFGQWLVTSDEFAQGQVDFAWQLVFGQPLLGRWPGTTEDGQAEREALARALGQQLIAHDFDLSTLVTWLAKSQGFQRKSADLDVHWYLSAGDTDLRNANRRTQMLAVFPATRDQNLRVMSRVVQLTESVVPKAVEKNGVLANPLLPTNPSKAIARQPLNNASTQAKRLTPQQIEYLARVYALPSSMESQLDRILKSKLTWHQMVEHAFLMTGFEPPNANELAAADHILDWTRDRRQTLHRILAARL